MTVFLILFSHSLPDAKLQSQFIMTNLNTSLEKLKWPEEVQAMELLSFQPRNSLFLPSPAERYPKVKQPETRTHFPVLNANQRHVISGNTEVESIKWIRHGAFFSLSKCNVSQC